MYQLLITEKVNAFLGNYVREFTFKTKGFFLTLINLYKCGFARKLRKAAFSGAHLTELHEFLTTSKPKRCFIPDSKLTDDSGQHFTPPPQIVCKRFPIGPSMKTYWSPNYIICLVIPHVHGKRFSICSMLATNYKVFQYSRQIFVSFNSV